MTCCNKVLVLRSAAKRQHRCLAIYPTFFDAPLRGAHFWKQCQSPGSYQWPACFNINSKGPSPQIHRSNKTPESQTSIEDEILNSFYRVKPFSLEAVNLIHSIIDSDSDLLDIPMKRQILLLYKVLQHCWVESLSELYQCFPVYCLC
jgi:hypothetical protein